jgi:hypothetical protein
MPCRAVEYPYVIVGARVDGEDSEIGGRWFYAINPGGGKAVG